VGDKSPRKTQTKKVGKSLKEKRAEKNQKQRERTQHGQHSLGEHS
jgi:hypothetical protein